MIRKIEVALLVAVLLAPVILPVCAQDTTTRLPATNGKKKKLIAQRAESGGTGEGAWRLLKQPMELPDLPRYSGTGCLFVEGLMYPNKPGGAAISMIYHAKETPDVVIGWYADALKSYQWKVTESSNLKAPMVTGQHGHHGVTVTVAPMNSKGFKTELRINFKLAH